MSPRGYSQMLEPRSASNQSIVRPVTVWPSLPKYRAREQASDMVGKSKVAERSEAMARRVFTVDADSLIGMILIASRTGLAGRKPAVRHHVRPFTRVEASAKEKPDPDLSSSVLTPFAVSSYHPFSGDGYMELIWVSTLSQLKSGIGSFTFLAIIDE